MERQKIGQYRVIDRLGKGGMGKVYRATDEMLGREVALKVLEPTVPDAAARFRAEAAALARLAHPGIATLYEFFEDDGRLVMAMELVRGHTLQQILEQAGVFSPRRAAELCMQTLAAIEHAHAAGVVHRDLKPGNLMITEGGSIKITDFGIARLDGSVNLTAAGAMMGTPAYMAPEQVLGLQIDARADLYAVGVVFFRLVTGALPFKGDTPFNMAQSQVKDAPARASDIRADLPDWVDTILARALAKHPGDRFQSAMEFHEAFAQAIANSPQAVVPAGVEATEMLPRPTAAYPTAGAPKPRRRRAGWLVPAAIVVVAVAAWAVVPRVRTAPDRPISTAPIPAPETPDIKTDLSPAPASVAPSPADAAGNRAAAVVPIAASTTSPAVTDSTPVTHSPLPPASFKDVKVLSTDGARASIADVVLGFSDAGVSVQSPGTDTVSTVVPYHRITKATYARGRDPKWDPALSAPTGKIDLPGKVDLPGIFGRSRHWLVLQGPDRYLILRLDGDDRLDVMKAFETHAGMLIDRSSAGK